MVVKHHMGEKKEPAPFTRASWALHCRAISLARKLTHFKEFQSLDLNLNNLKLKPNNDPSQNICIKKTIMKKKDNYAGQ